MSAIEDRVWRKYRPGTVVVCRVGEFRGSRMVIEEQLDDRADGHALYWCQWIDERGQSRHCELKRTEFTPARSAEGYRKRLVYQRIAGS
jgi:hypothetical protein